MRIIDNTYLAKPNVEQAGSKSAPAEVARQSGAATNSLDAVSGHTPSPELVQLVNQVRQSPEVRQKRLQEVAERLANNEYLTPEAAERTADAILNASE